MKVICIRLTSGEEVIAKLEEKLMGGDQFTSPGPWSPQGEVTINTVRGVTFQPVGQNQMGIAFVPWTIGNIDGSQIINLGVSAVSIYEPTADLERGYLEQTSGIQLSGTSGLAKPGLKM